MHEPIRFNSENEKGPKYLLIRPRPFHYFWKVFLKQFLRKIFYWVTETNVQEGEKTLVINFLSFG